MIMSTKVVVICRRGEWKISRGDVADFAILGGGRSGGGGGEGGSGSGNRGWKRDVDGDGVAECGGGYFYKNFKNKSERRKK